MGTNGNRKIQKLEGDSRLNRNNTKRRGEERGGEGRRGEDRLEARFSSGAKDLPLKSQDTQNRYRW